MLENLKRGPRVLMTVSYLMHYITKSYCDDIITKTIDSITWTTYAKLIPHHWNRVPFNISFQIFRLLHFCDSKCSKHEKSYLTKINIMTSFDHNSKREFITTPFRRDMDKKVFRWFELYRTHLWIRWIRTNIQKIFNCLSIRMSWNDYYH